MTARCWRTLHGSELVRPVRAEDEFELEKSGIEIATREEEVFFEKVVIVLQSNF